MQQYLEQTLDQAESIIESAQQRPSESNYSSDGEKSLHQKLYDIYVEEYEKEPEEIQELKSNANLLEKLVKRESLPCLIVNLYPGKEGYSLMLKEKNGSCSESIHLPYDEAELLEYFDAEELPPILVDLLDKSKINVFHSGCVIAEIRDYRQSSDVAPPEYQSRHILLRPAMQTLACDVQSIGSDSQEWCQEDKLLLESQKFLATAEPLCLDPSDEATCTENRLLYNKQKMNTRPMKGNLKRHSASSLNRQQELSGCSPPPELSMVSSCKRSKGCREVPQYDLKISEGSYVDMWKQRPCDLAVPSEIDVEKYMKGKKPVSHSHPVAWSAQEVKDDYGFGFKSGRQSQTAELIFMQSPSNPLISGQRSCTESRCERPLSPPQSSMDDHSQSIMPEYHDLGSMVSPSEELVHMDTICPVSISSAGSANLSLLSQGENTFQAETMLIPSSILGQEIEYMDIPMTLPSSSEDSSSWNIFTPEQTISFFRFLSPDSASKPPASTQTSPVEVNRVHVTAALSTSSTTSSQTSQALTTVVVPNVSILSTDNFSQQAPALSTTDFLQRSPVLSTDVTQKTLASSTFNLPQRTAVLPSTNLQETIAPLAVNSSGQTLALSTITSQITAAPAMSQISTTFSTAITSQWTSTLPTISSSWENSAVPNVSSSQQISSRSTAIATPYASSLPTVSSSPLTSSLSTVTVSQYASSLPTVSSQPTLTLPTVCSIQGALLLPTVDSQRNLDLSTVFSSQRDDQRSQRAPSLYTVVSTQTTTSLSTSSSSLRTVVLPTINSIQKTLVSSNIRSSQRIPALTTISSSQRNLSNQATSNSVGLSNWLVSPCHQTQSLVSDSNPMPESTSVNRAPVRIVVNKNALVSDSNPMPESTSVNRAPVRIVVNKNALVNDPNSMPSSTSMESAPVKIVVNSSALVSDSNPMPGSASLESAPVKIVVNSSALVSDSNPMPGSASLDRAPVKIVVNNNALVRDPNHKPGSTSVNRAPARVMASDKALVSTPNPMPDSTSVGRAPSRIVVSYKALVSAHNSIQSSTSVDTAPTRTMVSNKSLVSAPNPMPGSSLVDRAPIRIVVNNKALMSAPKGMPGSSSVDTDSARIVVNNKASVSAPNPIPDSTSVGRAPAIITASKKVSVSASSPISHSTSVDRAPVRIVVNRDLVSAPSPMPGSTSVGTTARVVSGNKDLENRPPKVLPSTQQAGVKLYLKSATESLKPITLFQVPQDSLLWKMHQQPQQPQHPQHLCQLVPCKQLPQHSTFHPQPLVLQDPNGQESTSQKTSSSAQKANRVNLTKVRGLPHQSVVFSQLGTLQKPGDLPQHRIHVVSVRQRQQRPYLPQEQEPVQQQVPSWSTATTTTTEADPTAENLAAPSNQSNVITPDS